jgi:NAD-dependent SIR2 family protein deacetylase
VTYLDSQSLAFVVDRLRSASRITVLTGAGISAASGVPTFRGPEGLWRTFRPDQLATPEAFRRDPRLVWEWYDWRRQRIAACLPNSGHNVLAAWSGRLPGFRLITQNVDGLHERAGNRSLCALHGRIADVICLDCRRTTGRGRLQDRMEALNPGFVDRPEDLVARPDGDVELDETERFVVPPCESCGGVLKPDVVFFGENVPKPRVQRCYDAVEAADALLVAGSSLTVLSGFRFVRHAHKLQIPVVIVNRGSTRGDELAAHKVEAGCAEFLTALADRAAGGAPGGGADGAAAGAQETSRRTESITPRAASTSP